jgi:hypothetical protein
MRASMAAFAAIGSLEISRDARQFGNKFENTLF